MGKQLIEYTVPTWTLSALINADLSGLTEEDIESLDKFIERVSEDHGNAIFMLGDESENSWFSWSNDFDKLGSEVTKLYLLKTN